MLETGNNWELFGFDVRRIGKHWSSAWKDFLWGYDSPVKARLDELVLVHSEQGKACYHGGRQVENGADASCEAVLLPDDLVLNKRLEFPLAAEADLDSVMAMEVGAHSPFPADDTGCGWKVVDRSESVLRVQLAVVSLSAAMSFLGREYDCHESRTYEVWARVNGTAVVIKGFGEVRREARYRKRLIRVGALSACAVVLFVALFGIAAGSKYVELQGVRRMAAAVEREAANASELRSALALANETVAGAGKYQENHPNPHTELARVTRLLGDEAFVQQFSMEGREIRLRGQAENAAKVMEQLISEPAYVEVTAPQAITKMGNTGMERFVLNIKLAGALP
jgi:hypothetical protein